MDPASGAEVKGAEDQFFPEAPGRPLFGHRPLFFVEAVHQPLTRFEGELERFKEAGTDPFAVDEPVNHRLNGVRLGGIERFHPFDFGHLPVDQRANQSRFGKLL